MRGRRNRSDRRFHAQLGPAPDRSCAGRGACRSGIPATVKWSRSDSSCAASPAATTMVTRATDVAGLHPAARHELADGRRAGARALRTPGSDRRIRHLDPARRQRPDGFATRARTSTGSGRSASSSPSTSSRRRTRRRMRPTAASFHSPNTDLGVGRPRCRADAADGRLGRLVAGGRLGRRVVFRPPLGCLLRPVGAARIAGPGPAQPPAGAMPRARAGHPRAAGPRRPDLVGDGGPRPCFRFTTSADEGADAGGPHFHVPSPPLSSLEARRSSSQVRTGTASTSPRSGRPHVRRCSPAGGYIHRRPPPRPARADPSSPRLGGLVTGGTSGITAAPSCVTARRQAEAGPRSPASACSPGSGFRRVQRRPRLAASVSRRASTGGHSRRGTAPTPPRRGRCTNGPPTPGGRRGRRASRPARTPRRS